ncbi:hypothetical protein BATDEDRAFT_8571 [Batrachochytrium dendrobatidis JAM81]|uniref:Guanine deaminase n=1 Tax=Batrachochytrium dendrobatidis (strain JAM81 / FGSC 10211) TaxID=684364 RepID=F4NU48_BATDJ|nr:guanine deaminase [Batrachochytrium dendrobatidis JAM81]EGF84379.1 hypothetical protein BATDEDRAFT_8571 [Batrachochytrium dendrobatidis JAM81]|eukprot:XP_006675026.1 hypothetical protein BATDEDRAFT_8571 [Batrachochytrium dendrobatidis JAM81]
MIDAEGIEPAITIGKVIVGQLYHSLSISNLQYLPCAIVGVSTIGTIAFVESTTINSPTAIEALLSTLQQQWQFDSSVVTRLSSTQFIVPGFVDTHIHAPQYVFTGTGYDLTLLEWLEKYTFPREAAFNQPEYALDSYQKVVRKTLRHGTTTACYFATTHLDAAKTLTNVIHTAGQRAFVGKVNMDRNSPDYYVETMDESLQATMEIVGYIQDTIKSSLITPVITPRFVPTCTSDLMQKLGSLAAKHNLPIQSHLSETPGEIQWVKELHPDCQTYSDVYDRHGLFTSKTIMAHCVHLNQHERDLLKAREVGISHCPSSNFCLHSGVFNLRRLVNEGHSKIGLGTDVAGGYSSSLMDAMRQAIIASKVIHVNMDTTVYEPLTFSEAFYLATLGGAKVMALEHTIGNFMPGKSFDALLIDTASPIPGVESGMDIFAHDDAMSIFEKFIYLGDDRNIVTVFVQGHVVSTRLPLQD